MTRITRQNFVQLKMAAAGIITPRTLVGKWVNDRATQGELKKVFSIPLNMAICATKS